MGVHLPSAEITNVFRGPWLFIIGSGGLNSGLLACETLVFICWAISPGSQMLISYNGSWLTAAFISRLGWGRVMWRLFKGEKSRGDRVTPAYCEWCPLEGKLGIHSLQNLKGSVTFTDIVLTKQNTGQSIPRHSHRGWAVWVSFKCCLLCGRLGRWKPSVLLWQAGDSRRRVTKMKPIAAGAGYVVCHTKLKNNWEQLGMSNSNFGTEEKSNSTILSDGRHFHGWGNCLPWFPQSMRAEGWGQGSRLSPQVHKSDVGLECRWQNEKKSKAHGRPWDIAVGWNLAPWLGKHPHVEGNYWKTKVFCGQSRLWGMDPFHATIPPTPHSGDHHVHDCQVLMLSRVPSASVWNSSIKANFLGVSDLFLCLLAEYGYR